MTEIQTIHRQILTIAKNQPITVIGIDGMGGAGKSTLAGKLEHQLSSTHHVITLHIDDFITPRSVRYNEQYPEWECYYHLQWRYDYFVNIIQQILKFPSDGITLELYNKETDTYTHKTYDIHTPSIVLVEGVFLQRRELQGLFHYMLYMEVPENLRLERVQRRDTYIGDESQITSKYVNRYFPAENHYIETCHPAEHADYIIQIKTDPLRYKAVIFDMDGIIFDSERLKLKNWIALAQKEGIPDIENTFRKCIGLNYEGNRQVFQERYGSSVDFENFKEKAGKLYHEAADHGKLPQKPGIKELLTFLKEYGIKIGVASSTKEALVRQQLLEGGLFNYFDVILGGDHVKNGKPDPEIYLKTCATLDVNPAETFAIEDSFNGIRSAHAAGINVIMVPDLVEPNEEISKLCVCVQSDHFHILEYFKKEL